MDTADLMGVACAQIMEAGSEGLGCLLLRASVQTRDSCSCQARRGGASITYALSGAGAGARGDGGVRSDGGHFYLLAWYLPIWDGTGLFTYLSTFKGQKREKPLTKHSCNDCCQYVRSLLPASRQ